MLFGVSGLLLLLLLLLLHGSIIDEGYPVTLEPRLTQLSHIHSCVQLWEHKGWYPVLCDGLF